MTVGEDGLKFATLGLDVYFLKGWDMRLIRSLGTLVLLGCVSLMLGCNAEESTSGGPGGSPVGSGVAGGAVVPHTHDADDDHGHETDAPKADAPEADAPKEEAPAADAPKEEAPKADAPKEEAPKADAPAEDAPKSEEPKAE